jgi:hypothetical protein
MPVDVFDRDYDREGLTRARRQLFLILAVVIPQPGLCWPRSHLCHRPGHRARGTRGWRGRPRSPQLGRRPPDFSRIPTRFTRFPAGVYSLLIIGRWRKARLSLSAEIALLHPFETRDLCHIRVRRACRTAALPERERLLRLPRFRRHTRSHENAVGVCHGEEEATIPACSRPLDTSDGLDSSLGSSPYREIWGRNRNRCPVRPLCPARIDDPRARNAPTASGPGRFAVSVGGVA